MYAAKNLTKNTHIVSRRIYISVKIELLHIIKIKYKIPLCIYIYINSLTYHNARDYYHRLSLTNIIIIIITT